MFQRAEVGGGLRGLRRRGSELLWVGLRGVGRGFNPRDTRRAPAESLPSPGRPLSGAGGERDASRRPGSARPEGVRRARTRTRLPHRGRADPRVFAATRAQHRNEPWSTALLKKKKKKQRREIVMSLGAKRLRRKALRSREMKRIGLGLLNLGEV